MSQLFEKPQERNFPPKMENTRPLTIDKIKDETTTDFDLFVKLSSGLEVYAVSPYVWTSAELKRLSKQGHGVLYYCTEDQSKVEAYEKVAMVKPIDMNVSPEDRVLAITDTGAEITRLLFEFPLTKSTMNLAENVADNLVQTVLEDPSCVKALGLLAHHDYYTYYHSSRVAAYSLAIAITQTQFSEDHLRDIALGCLLHDIGKSKVDLEIINKRGKLSEKEWGRMQQHPIFGDKLVDESILSAVPRSIILSHHERTDGKGYPFGLTKNEVFDEVRIASFADVFDALTTNRPYQPSRSKFEALDFIRFNLIEGLDKEVYKAMVALLNNGKLPDSAA